MLSKSSVLIVVVYEGVLIAVGVSSGAVNRQIYP